MVSVSTPPEGYVVRRLLSSGRMGPIYLADAPAHGGPVALRFVTAAGLYTIAEYVDGETLRELLLRRAGIADADRLRWLDELCVAVAAAHALGEVHGHLDPTTVIIDRSGTLR